jgi:hypothetical protein
MESILITIRSGLGIEADFDGFDSEIIMAINNAIFSLNQLGIGPDGGFSITGIDETWDQLFDTVPNLEAAKSYILLKTRLEFDPPTTSFLVDAIDRQILEAGWRLMVEVDPDVVPEV